VRKIISGGTNGISERRKYLIRARQVLANYPAAATTAPLRLRQSRMMKLKVCRSLTLSTKHA